VLLQGCLRSRESFIHAGQFLVRCPGPFLSLGDVRQGANILSGEFLKAFLVEVDAAVVSLLLGL
jgi:hypothetical protein